MIRHEPFRFAERERENYPDRLNRIDRSGATRMKKADYLVTRSTSPKSLSAYSLGIANFSHITFRVGLLRKVYNHIDHLAGIR